MQINLIYGPPGTGKTTYLMNLLEKLMVKYHPSQIAFCSYTRKGCYEGRSRAMEKFNLADKDFPYFRTLHSMAFQALETRRADMLSRHHYRTFSEKMGLNFTGYYTEDFSNDDDQYLFFDILYRNNPDAAKKMLLNMDSQKLAHVRKNYRRFRDHTKTKDFTDLIEQFVDNKMKVPVEIAIIDEAQDLTTLQWKMVWTAFSKCKEVYIAGDDDQAIYQWSGADVNYFLNLKGKTTILNRSYRIPDNLVPFCKTITKQITKRVEKEFTGTEKKGRLEFISELEEVPIKKGKTYLILSRNNYYLNKAAKLLKERGIVYKQGENLSVDKSLVRDALRYRQMQIQKDPSLMTGFLRNRLKKNFNLNNYWYKSFKKVVEPEYHHKVMKKYSHEEILNPAIEISTIHSIKGGEADNVILISDITSNVYKSINDNPDSEHRVFYVGVSRMKENLYILSAKSKHEYIFFRKNYNE